VLTHTRDFWITQLEAVGVPCGPINNLDDVYKNPQVLARELVIDVPHPTAGSVKLVRSPMKLSVSPADNAVAPPLLGQHTGEVLRELLGQSEEQIAALRAKGVL
jgi:crotonobetainyl-CoA:carnitine CoA-transferase CaiB-like acyl-CoA transferase